MTAEGGGGAGLTADQQAHVVGALPQARQIARGIRRGAGVTIDDVVQMVAEGFTEAARGFDPGRDVAFAAYARQRGWGKAIDGVERAARQLPTRRLAGIDGALEATEEAVDETDLWSPTDETIPNLRAYCRAAMFRVLVGDVVVGLGHDSEGAFLQSRDESRAKKELAAVIRALPERDRAILELRHWQDRPWSEVGAAVGLGEEAVKSRYRRLLVELREALGPALGP